MEVGEASARHTEIQPYPFLLLFKVSFGVWHRNRLVEKRGMALHIPIEFSTIPISRPPRHTFSAFQIFFVGK
jgi:hypothetical protein